MLPFERIKTLSAEEYRVLKEAVAGRETPAGRTRRVKYGSRRSVLWP